MTEKTHEPVDGQGAEEPQQLTEEQAANMSYEDFLKLANPGMPDEEIQKMIRKERRYAWIGRIQIILLLLIVILIVYFIVTK